MVPEQPKPVTLLAIVAADRDRLTSLLAPHLVGALERVIVFDPTLTEVPTLSGFKAEFFDALLGGGSTDNNRELIYHSLPGLFSLRQPNAVLREVFPGLREVGRRNVPQVSFTALTECLGEDTERVTLILDLPGEEIDLLSQMERRGFLERIKEIKLRCGADCFFDGAKTADELQEWLAAKDFFLVHRDDSDSAWPILEFATNHERRRISTLERELAERDIVAANTKATITEADKRQQALVNDIRKLRLALRDSDEIAMRRRTEFDRMRADHGMLLSMLQARAEELTELREDYRQLSDEKRALQELLAKLTPRLREAASQLQSLVFLPGQSNPNVQAVPGQEKDNHYRKRKGHGQ